MVETTNEEKPAEGKRGFERKKPLSVVEEKIKKIKASKMPKEQKEWYVKKLMGEEPVEENGLIPFEIYAKIKNIKGGEYVGKESFADSQNIKKLKLESWDELFKKF